MLGIVAGVRDCVCDTAFGILVLVLDLSFEKSCFHCCLTIFPDPIYGRFRALFVVVLCAHVLVCGEVPDFSDGSLVSALAQLRVAFPFDFPACLLCIGDIPRDGSTSPIAQGIGW